LRLTPVCTVATAQPLQMPCETVQFRQAAMRTKTEPWGAQTSFATCLRRELELLPCVCAVGCLSHGMLMPCIFAVCCPQRTKPLQVQRLTAHRRKSENCANAVLFWLAHVACNWLALVPCNPGGKRPGRKASEARGEIAGLLLFVPTTQFLPSLPAYAGPTALRAHASCQVQHGGGRGA
jgi:hypothetical protein